MRTLKPRERLVAELEKRGIPSRVDEKDRVWFPTEHGATVHEIAFQLMESAEPDRESFAFVEPEYTEMLIARLRSTAIPFNTEIKEGVTYVVLDSMHKPQWAPIKNEVEELFVADKKSSLMKRKNETPSNQAPQPYAKKRGKTKKGTEGIKNDQICVDQKYSSAGTGISSPF